MDPNETLGRMREATRRYEQITNLPTFSVADAIDAAADVISASQDLDKWISKGGFLPEAWNRRGR